MIKNIIIVCVDGLVIFNVVCDIVVWVSQILGVFLIFFYVLEKICLLVKEDLFGVIGLGSCEYLLDELIVLDEQCNKLVIEYGKYLFEDVKIRVEVVGVVDVYGEQ